MHFLKQHYCHVEILVWLAITSLARFYQKLSKMTFCVGLILLLDHVTNATFFFFFPESESVLYTPQLVSRNY